VEEFPQLALGGKFETHKAASFRVIKNWFVDLNSWLKLSCFLYSSVPQLFPGGGTELKLTAVYGAVTNNKRYVRIINFWTSERTSGSQLSETVAHGTA
jgi:hypothetical protein